MVARAMLVKREALEKPVDGWSLKLGSELLPQMASPG